MDILFTRRTVLAGLAASAAATAHAAGDGKAPTFVLAGPDGRAIQVSEWRPRGRERGLILFSHGALSAPWKYDRLIGPWVADGYRVLAPLHVDSTDHPDTKRYAGLQSWRARVEDMRALTAHVGSRRYVAAGHSYGGLVALALGGAEGDVPEGLTGPLFDRRPVAAVAFSPPAPTKGLISADGYGKLAVPALIQTGTRDVPPGAPDMPDAWKLHLGAYDSAAAGGDRYALVLDGVDHYFGGAICRLDLPGPPQLAQLAIAGELSALFLDAFGRGDSKARARLDARIGTNGLATLSRK